MLEKMLKSYDGGGGVNHTHQFEGKSDFLGDLRGKSDLAIWRG